MIGQPRILTQLPTMRRDHTGGDMFSPSEVRRQKPGIEREGAEVEIRSEV